MAAYPDTTRAFRRSKGDYPRSIVPSTETLPQTLNPKDVVIRVHAVSLNHRDIAMLKEGKYPSTYIPDGIPTSDFAGEIVAVGNKVQKFGVGDRVVPTIDFNSLTGEERNPQIAVPGGDIEGFLSEYVVLNENVLSKFPKHLSWEEAATITCAGITAWVALERLKLKPNPIALLQGTGGVSLFALQLCIAAGIKPIITSSSDEKIEKVKKLSPEIEGVNYKTSPDFAAEVLRLTKGQGVDVVINNAGPSWVATELKTLAKHGSIVTVGILEGFNSALPVEVYQGLFMKAAKLQGILGGSRKDLEDLNQFLDEKKVKLDILIDRAFAFEDSPAAFDYLASAKHVGKVIIKL